MQSILLKLAIGRGYQYKLVRYEKARHFLVGYRKWELENYGRTSVEIAKRIFNLLCKSYCQWIGILDQDNVALCLTEKIGDRNVEQAIQKIKVKLAGHFCHLIGSAQPLSSGLQSKLTFLEKTLAKAIQLLGLKEDLGYQTYKQSPRKLTEVPACLFLLTLPQHVGSQFDNQELNSILCLRSMDSSHQGSP